MVAESDSGVLRSIGAKPEASVGLIVQTLRATPAGACLIIGPGVSASGGVPTAAGLVDLVREHFPETYRLATAGNGETPAPEAVMGWLSDGESAALIARVLAGVRLNWEHLVIADLLARKLVGTVVSLNYDRLPVVACARVGAAPATVDLAAIGSATTISQDVPTIVHVCGRDQGVFAPARQDAKEHERVRALIDRIVATAAPIIVLGCDDGPVIDSLAARERFPNRLFWVGDGRRAPPALARRLIERADNGALLVRGYDAESFLNTLARALDAFPPRLVVDPIDAARETLTMLPRPRDINAVAHIDAALMRLGGAPMVPTARADTPSEVPPHQAAPRRRTDSRPAETAKPATTRATEEPTETSAEAVLIWPPKKRARPPVPGGTPRSQSSSPRPSAATTGPAVTTPAAPDQDAPVVPAAAPKRRPPVAAAEEGLSPRLLLVIGDYRRLLTEYEAGGLRDEDGREAVAWAHVMLGNRAARRAETSPRIEALNAWNEATDHYRAALEIDPRHADALFNWASVVAAQARAADDADAPPLWTEAVARHEAVLAVSPDDADALVDCARALLAAARFADGEQARVLIDRALARFERAARSGSANAYVGFLEVALAHRRWDDFTRLRAATPPPLTAGARYALALVDLIAAITRDEATDVDPFDALARRADAPCRGWDFTDILAASARLDDADADFVESLVEFLDGRRPAVAWPEVRDSWLAGRLLNQRLRA